MAQGSTATNTNVSTPTTPNDAYVKTSTEKSRASIERQLEVSPKEIATSASNTADDSQRGSGGVEGALPAAAAQPIDSPQNPATVTGQVPKGVESVLYSDIGISTLLTRLKQSIASARDYSTFLKKRAIIEDEHAQGIKKLNRSTAETVRRQEGRQGSYAHQLADMTRAQDRTADNGIQFAASLHQMHEDLNELISNIERGRKNWKQEGLNSEKRVKDAETQMEKAKSRYDSLAEDYDRARTGDKSLGRVFTVKGPKSAEKHEEDLYKKLQSADADYAAKVQAAQAARHENLTFNRPNALRNLQDLIKECDSALVLQLQKFAALSERLLVGNGLIISPIKQDPRAGALSIREMVQLINNENDFHTYVAGHVTQVPPTPAEIKYEKHPTLAAMQQSSSVPQQLTVQQQRRMSQPLQSQHVDSATSIPSGGMTSTQHGSSPSSAGPNPGPGQHDRQPSNLLQQYATQAAQSPSQLSQQIENQPISPEQSQRGFTSSQYPVHVQNGQGITGDPSSLPSSQQHAASNEQYGGLALNGSHSQQQHSYSTKQTRPSRADVALSSRDLPPAMPSFGISLDSLFRRDETAVPMVVYQCIQAVDLFGLEVEGIYRLSGNSTHINQLKAVFDTDSSRVDFRNPENFFHDVNSVAGLLKQFFRELPDPLLTQEHYSAFIEAAKIEEDALRRDSLHAVINVLPDPNYATLRALVLHLHRVQEHCSSNRMSSSNLAICFAPTIMGTHNGPVADAGLQARVVDTILQNTYQIFDED